jgi:hypothetical protein
MSFNRPEAQTVFEFAYTTGELYQRHLELAQSGASILDWNRHVINSVVPLFAKEFRVAESKLIFPPKNVAACAEMLQAYYSEHVKEL